MSNPKDLTDSYLDLASGDAAAARSCREAVNHGWAVAV